MCEISWKSKQKGCGQYRLIFTLRMAWTVWRGYVAVVATALATAPMRKISAEEICGRRQRLNPIISSVAAWTFIKLLDLSYDQNIKWQTGHSQTNGPYSHTMASEMSVCQWIAVTFHTDSPRRGQTQDAYFLEFDVVFFDSLDYIWTKVNRLKQEVELID